MKATQAEQIAQKLKEQPIEALRLANEFYRQTPSPESYQCLLEALLTNAQHGIQNGKIREAIIHLNAIERLSPTHPVEVIVRLVELFTAMGELTRAKLHLEAVPADHPNRKELSAQIADQAIQQGAAGKKSIPVEWHPAFDAVLHAFQNYQKGKDAEVRSCLEVIGLSSPYLEWKLLLRGLLAWIAKDDAKAIENWKRLNPKRLPYQIAKLHWVQIDPSLDSQNASSKSAQRLAQLDPITKTAIQELEVFQRLNSLDQFHRWLKRVPKWFPNLRKKNPKLAERIAQVAYWHCVNTTESSTIELLRNSFPSFPNDPDLYRLTALATGRIQVLEVCFENLKRYATWFADNPLNFPASHHQRILAMIFLRMSKIAHSYRNGLAKPNPLLVNDFEKHFQIKYSDAGKFHYLETIPSFMECLEQAYHFAPDWADTGLNLLKEYQSTRNPKALPLADSLLEKFPQNLEMLITLADVYRNAKQYQKAIKALDLAIAIQSLHEKLHDTRDFLCIAQARELISSGEPIQPYLDQIRRVQNPLNMHFIFLIELTRKIVQEGYSFEQAWQEITSNKSLGGTLGSIFSLLVELSYQKMPTKKLKPYREKLLQALNDMVASDLERVVILIEYYREQKMSYVGMKSHESKLLNAARKIINTHEFTEPELVMMLSTFWRVKQFSLLKSLSKRGQSLFPNNPYCYYYLAEMYLHQFGTTPQGLTPETRKNFRKAYQLASKSPEKYGDLLQLLQKRCHEEPAIDPVLN